MGDAWWVERVTDLAQLARDTLTASQKATPGPWKRDGGALGAPGHGWIFNGGISPPCTTGNGLNDIEFIALMRTAGPVLAQHVLDLRKAAQAVVDELDKHRASLDFVVADRLRAALEKIASCESHAPGDVVDVARAALAEKEPK